jgi:hypothetical protein
MQPVTQQVASYDERLTQAESKITNLSGRLTGVEGTLRVVDAKSEQALNLETAVGRARWWVRAGGWREATTRQAHACEEERQSQLPVRACQRARSALTQSVTPAKARALAFSRRSSRQAAVNCGF